MNNNNISHFYFTDDILIGDPDIDADHRAFFEISNILNESIYTGSNILVISSAVLMLKEYVDGHFWREEKAMQKARYPYILKHKFLHDKFRRKLNDVIAAFDGGDLNAVYDLPKLVVSWVRLQWLVTLTHHLPFGAA